MRTHKIRLNPTPEQEQWLLQACGVARFAFNWGLERWREQYEAGEKPSAYSLKKQFNAIKREEFPWSMNVTKYAVDTGFLNLDNAFKNFFRRCKNGDTKKGYPRFKSKKRSRKSFRMDGNRVKINRHWIKLPRLDDPVNMAEELRLDGEIKSVIVLKDACHWYAAINVEVEHPKHKHNRGTVGIDLGLKTLATLSDGNQYENKRLLRSELTKLRRLNREMSRRQEGSGRWRRSKAKLTKFHRRIVNRRLDYQHKVTTGIARTYQVISVEDLNVAGMLRNHRLALSISDAGFGEIRRQLQYKAERYGGEFVEVDRWFPSSKLCRFCGHVNSNLVLADRVWTCDCGAVLDRDQNAALNIEQQGLRILSHKATRPVVATSDVKGRGQRVRPFGATLVEASTSIVYTQER